MIALTLGLFALAAWIGLALTGFWRTDQRDDTAAKAEPAAWPSVVAVVPARDEAAVVGAAMASLAAQNYPGAFRILLVDDNSSDGTAALARNAGGGRLEVLPGRPLAPGWTGKLWAMHQGIGAAGTPDLLWLTDADIAHAPDTLRTLVAIAHGGGGRALVSFMAELRCAAPAERALVPAFVWFFGMLYPFARVNRPGRTAAAAGGCVLVRRDALARAGGIAAIRGALIDDCALGGLVKREGPVWLGLTHRSRSIRPYDDAGAIAAMISRSAYAQLGYRPLNLVGTVLGLALLYAVPMALVLFGAAAVRVTGLAAWALMALLFQPMLRFYRRSPLWGAALPAIAAFYAGCTLLSAWQHHRGRGGQWKGRVQAAAGAGG